MSLSGTLSLRFFGGGSLSSLVPAIYSHALDGHAYLIDDALTGDLGFHHETIPVLKSQQQSDGKLGEQSINPNGLWRSSVESWHKGAGQTNYDLTDSDASRFSSSKGVDPWTKWELTLLNETTQLASSANTNLRLAATSTRLFWIDGTAVKYTDDLSTVSTMTGTKSWVSITSDGYYVYGTDGSDVYRWLRTDTSTGSAWNTTDMDLLVWVRGKGRLMAAKGASVYNVTGSSAPSDIKPSVISTDFVWSGFAEGPSVIYGAGYQGDKSLIFRWGIKTDGTIDVAIPALSDGLPDGEIVRSIYGYLGFVLIGTDKGVRFATAGDDGNLTVGELVDLNVSVRCFEGQGSFVWFGWSNFDSTSTGLGRMSLTTLNGSAPAYASDLMATASGSVLSAATFLDKRVFAVSGAGVYAEGGSPVSEGWLETGWRSFGIPENKVALQQDVRYEPLDGSVSVAVALDGSSTFTTVLSDATSGSTGTKVDLAEYTAQRFNSRYTLTPGTAAPVLTRDVLSVNPTADTGFFVILPVLLNEEDAVASQTIPRNPAAELMFLQELRAARTLVTYQEGSRSYPVSIEDFFWFPRSLTSDRSAYQGTAVLKLKVV